MSKQKETRRLPKLAGDYFSFPKEIDCDGCDNTWNPTFNIQEEAELIIAEERSRILALLDEHNMLLCNGSMLYNGEICGQEPLRCVQCATLQSLRAKITEK